MYERGQLWYPHTFLLVLRYGAFYKIQSQKKIYRLTALYLFLIAVLEEAERFNFKHMADP